MKKYLWIALALIVVAGLFACNKQKPVVLDYDKGGQNKMFDQKGLPGESYVGTPPEDAKHRGYDPAAEKGEKKEAKKEEVKKEEKKEEKKPPEKKPEEKK
jgi:hypothetical protein